MFWGNCADFDLSMYMNERYGTEQMGETRTNSNLTQGMAALQKVVRLRG